MDGHKTVDSFMDLASHTMLAMPINGICSAVVVVVVICIHELFASSL